MHSEFAIRATGVSKQYILGRAPQHVTNLSEAIAARLRNPFRGGKREATAPEDILWALDDVSFEIRQGEVVGIIGRNGAGKSTLLKILSRITAPTRGEVELHGRVASLLEVGTGFHPELSGRENIFLNGAVLGMSRREIQRKFDSIVEFAEVERFLDTPVKRYSSGMYVRLAFAVAAHLDPEILIVDEVLAVGDARFQKKCLAKMQGIGAQGRTVLFVSHNTQVVNRLCSTAILLDHGRVQMQGRTADVVYQYTHGETGSSVERRWESPTTAPGDDVVRLHSIRILDDQGRVSEAIDIRRPVQIEITYWTLQDGAHPLANFGLIDQDGTTVFISNAYHDPNWGERPRPIGMYRSTCTIPGNYLAEGIFNLWVAVTSHDPVVVHAKEFDAVAFQVIDRSEGDGVRGTWANEYPGVVRPMLPWLTERIEEERPAFLSLAGSATR